MTRRATCPRCGASVVVAFDRAGRRIILDPRPLSRIVLEGGIWARNVPTFGEHADVCRGLEDELHLEYDRIGEDPSAFLVGVAS